MERASWSLIPVFGPVCPGKVRVVAELRVIVAAQDARTVVLVPWTRQWARHVDALPSGN